MLALYDLKYHCRTCLIKIETAGDIEDAKRSVAICTCPDVEKLMRLCLNNRPLDVATDYDGLDTHMPNLCGLCFEKWQDFAKHCQLALKNDEQLRKILEKGEPAVEDSDGKCDETNKVFLDAKPATDFCEIEKYETASPFYQTSRSPSPDFQNEEEFINTSPSCPPSPFLPKSDDSSGDDDKSKADDIDNDISFDEPPTRSKKTKKPKQAKAPPRKPHMVRNKIKRKYKTKNSTSEKTDTADTEESQSKRKVYRCEPCKKYFYEILTYEGHIKRVHEGIKRAFQCKECDKAYSLYKNLVGHIAERHSAESQEIHKCEQCNKTYKTKTTLKKHMKLQHSNSNDTDSTANSKRVICDQCGFLAAHQDSLTQHIKNKHMETEEIKCEQCPKVFKSQYNLKYHIQSFHSKIIAKPFKCNECSMAFTRRPLLNIHKRSHLTYSERMKCDFEGCDVRFIKLSSKRRHMRLVHLKVKQHICDICGEAFGIKATLRHHRYIHTGEKPYKCNVCGQGFRQATAMKTHRKTHFAKKVATKPADHTGNAADDANVSLENNLSL